MRARTVPLNTLRVAEIFNSIQGEGLDMGRRTTFLRLAGCNLRCSWCDTAWAQESAGAAMAVEDVAAKCGKRLSITGGEPLLQDLEPLIGALRQPTVVGVETNGTIPPPEPFVRAVGRWGDVTGPVRWGVAPKPPSSGYEPDMGVLREFRQQPWVQFKWVFADEDDWNFALAAAAKLGAPAPMILQPVGQRWQEMARWAWGRMWQWEGFDARLLPQWHALVWGNERCR